MLVFGVTELGLSIDEFYGLSWYEWSLLVERNKRKNERDYDMWRQIICLLYNPYRGDNEALKPEDVIRLRTDVKPVEKSFDELVKHKVIKRNGD